MEQTFFQSLSPFITSGTIKLVIKKSEAEELIASVLFENDRSGDNAMKLIPPFIIRGTPEEMDNTFFAELSAPAHLTIDLLTNAEAYLKQLEKAKVESKMEKDKADGEKKVREEMRKKFESLMKSVDDLEGDKKIKEAIDLLHKSPELGEYQDHIKKRMNSLQQKFQPTMF